MNQKRQIQDMRQQGFSLSNIAETLGLSRNTVKSFCRRNEVIACDASEDTGIEENKDICKHCNTPLSQRSKQKPRRFCNDKCRHAWWSRHRNFLNKKALYHIKCEYCRKEFDSYGNSKRKYCCHACYIAARFGDDDRKAVAAI